MRGSGQPTRNGAQVIRFGSVLPYPLSHLYCQLFIFLRTDDIGIEVSGSQLIQLS